jgi:hypothetical protein
VISKKKKLEDTIELFNKNSKISDIHIMSRPHMRLESAEGAHEKLAELNCNKLRPLIKNLSDESHETNNVKETLDQVVR